MDENPEERKETKKRIESVRDPLESHRTQLIEFQRDSFMYLLRLIIMVYTAKDSERERIRVHVCTYTCPRARVCIYIYIVCYRTVIRLFCNYRYNNVIGCLLPTACDRLITHR